MLGCIRYFWGYSHENHHFNVKVDVDPRSPNIPITCMKTNFKLFEYDNNTLEFKNLMKENEFIKEFNYITFNKKKILKDFIIKYDGKYYKIINFIYFKNKEFKLKISKILKVNNYLMKSFKDNPVKETKLINFYNIFKLGNSENLWNI